MKNNDVKLSKAIIYCRCANTQKSKQYQDTHSQEMFCRAYAKNQRYQIVDVFTDEGASGDGTDRPAIRSMLSYLRKTQRGSHRVIVSDVSRLARDMSAYLKLRQYITQAGGVFETPHVKPDDGPDTELIADMLVAASEYKARKKAG